VPESRGHGTALDLLPLGLDGDRRQGFAGPPLRLRSRPEGLRKRTHVPEKDSESSAGRKTEGESSDPLSGLKPIGLRLLGTRYQEHGQNTDNFAQFRRNPACVLGMELS
jgi:hypothetical protein